jgi:hypothetical protein
MLVLVNEILALLGVVPQLVAIPLKFLKAPLYTLLPFRLFETAVLVTKSAVKTVLTCNALISLDAVVKF